MAQIAILGGTGPEGRGLAMRLAHAGEDVGIGSRDSHRGAAAAAEVATALQGAKVAGDSNEAVIEGADLVALCFPFAAAEAFLSAHEVALRGKIVIDVINPLQVRKGVFGVLPVPDGSAGLLVQRMLPKSRVVSAFKTISAEKLLHVDEPLTGDILLCGDDTTAKQEVALLVTRIPNLRPLDTGPLANSYSVEAITALLLNLNRHYKAQTAVRIVGID